MEDAATEKAHIASHQQADVAVNEGESVVVDVESASAHPAHTTPALGITAMQRTCMDDVDSAHGMIHATLSDLTSPPQSQAGAQDAAGHDAGDDDGAAFLSQTIHHNDVFDDADSRAAAEGQSQRDVVVAQSDADGAAEAGSQHDLQAVHTHASIAAASDRQQDTGTVLDAGTVSDECNVHRQACAPASDMVAILKRSGSRARFDDAAIALQRPMAENLAQSSFLKPNTSLKEGGSASMAHRPQMGSFGRSNGGRCVAP